MGIPIFLAAILASTIGTVGRAEAPETAESERAPASRCAPDPSAFQFEFEKTKETPTKEALRDAATYLVYATEGEPTKLASLVHEATKLATKQALERATTKYVKLLSEKNLSPLVREYIENLYFAIGNRRGVPKVMIMEKISYGPESQRAYRDAYMKLLREENEVRKQEQEAKAVEEAKREAASPSAGP